MNEAAEVNLAVLFMTSIGIVSNIAFVSKNIMYVW
jgi:hypothetical protein